MLFRSNDTATTAFLERQSATYSAGHDAARARDLALTDFTQAILGLNEFVYEIGRASCRERVSPYV